MGWPITALKCRPIFTASLRDANAHSPGPRLSSHRLFNPTRSEAELARGYSLCAAPRRALDLYAILPSKMISLGSRECALRDPVRHENGRCRLGARSALERVPRSGISKAWCGPATPNKRCLALLATALIVGLRRFMPQTSPRFCLELLGCLIGCPEAAGCRKMEFMNTHRPVTNCHRKSHDDFLETFERDDALWSNNESSVVVRLQDLTIRPSQDQSQRVLNPRRTL